MSAQSPPEHSSRPRTPWSRKLAPWLITLVCFSYLYTRIDAAAAREGQNVAGYLGGIFASVSWTRWLALMLPYSCFFLLVDTLVLWRVVNWFNARIAYGDLLPVRASSYIISILNEQVGKGAMALYLNRREGVPGWQLGSSMLFIMFCEFLYLLVWASIGVALQWNDLPERLEAFRLVPWFSLGGLLIFLAVVVFFRSERFASVALREGPLLHAFRQARPWQYGVILLLRSPALVAAAWVYARVAGLFGVEASTLEMLCYLPLVFFGTFVPGPFRPVAIALWTILYAGQEGPMAAFGFVQHNSFVLFNAAIGLLFLRRVNRELLEAGGSPPAAAESGPGA